VLRTHSILAKYGIPLASNQIEFSLARADPDKNGTLQACRDLNVSVIAYSPLAMGALTGKYSAAHPPSNLFRYEARTAPLHNSPVKFLSLSLFEGRYSIR